jgi:hypothetical protein
MRHVDCTVDLPVGRGPQGGLASWDSVVEHETAHALSFGHEFDGHDFDAPCDINDGNHPFEGVLWTKYDYGSIANESYCGDGRPGLSELDKLGLAIVYPDGSAIPIRAVHGFDIASGLLARRDDTLITEWAQRGALDDAVFLSTATWAASQSGTTYDLPSGRTLEVQHTGNGSWSVSGSFTDRYFRVKQLGPTSMLVDNDLHTALVMTITG